MADKKYDIIIIGAGIAGLAAGCYGRMNGYRTRIFESHGLPGGLCTSWQRGGFTFDGCIHWLIGSGPNNSLYQIWQELGAVQGRPMVNHEEYLRVEGADGKALILYTDVDRLEEHMQQLSPADHRMIREFTRAIRRFSRLSVPPRPTFRQSLSAFLSIIPITITYTRLGKLSIRQYAQRFQDPFLREAFGSILELPDFPILGLTAALGYMHVQCAGYPAGGSLEFAKAIEKRYLSLGGEISYHSRVEEIITVQSIGESQACGIRLADGSIHYADTIISAADGRTTIFDLLHGRYADPKIRKFYNELPLFPSLVRISLGVNRELSAEPHHIYYQSKPPILVAGELREYISIEHYAFDPALAPAGKSVIIVAFKTNYSYWQQLKRNGDLDYENAKKGLAEQVISILDSRFPGIREEVEVIDVATPLTYERYTGNWQGAIESWNMTPETLKIVMSGGLSKTLSGLKNFFMIGQWIQPGGGLSPAAVSARDVIRTIAQKDRKRFVTDIPAVN